MITPSEQLREISCSVGHGHTGIDLIAPYGRRSALRRVEQ
jgi:hypothetical protein